LAGSPPDSAGEIPPHVLEHWNNTLYGCTICQDVCPHNRRPIPEEQFLSTEEGSLPSTLDAEKLAVAADEDIRHYFHGTAMGMSWLGPMTIRRNAQNCILCSGVKL
jgi:epoxyqueuosine reductase QueG